jgi:hypothetical protein
MQVKFLSNMKKNIIKLEDYEKILDIEITPNQHFLLGVIDSKNKELFLRYTKIEREDKLKNDLYLLWTKGLLEGFDEKNYLINFDNLIVNTTTVKVAIPSEDPFYLECWELFPKGIKTGGYPVRSDKKEFSSKFQRFEKTYPEFNRELIKQAFEAYINDFKKRNYDYMTLAGYFIFKKDGKDEKSLLATICQYLIDNKDKDVGRTGTFISI